MILNYKYNVYQEAGFDIELSNFFFGNIITKWYTIVVNPATINIAIKILFSSLKPSRRIDIPIIIWAMRLIFMDVKNHNINRKIRLIII